MTLKYEQDGVNPDGTPHFTVTSDMPDPHFLVTGPDVSGVMRTSDGSSYDVTAPVIELATHRHAVEIANEIGFHHERAGTFGGDFKYKAVALPKPEKKG